MRHVGEERYRELLSKEATLDEQGHETNVPDWHRKRHRYLHSCLDELIADWIGRPGNQQTRLNQPVMDLIKWSASEAGYDSTEKTESEFAQRIREWTDEETRRGRRYRPGVPLPPK